MSDDGRPGVPMRRLAILLLFLPVLIGAGPRYNVLDYGAVPGDRAACTRALDAIADAIESDPSPGVEVYFPAATKSYDVTHPIYLGRDGVTARGDGPKLSRLRGLFYDGPTLVLGPRRRPTGKTFDAAGHALDLYGVLDAKVAPKAGALAGYRTRNDAHIAFWATAFSQALGGWEQARVLHFDLGLWWAAPPTTARLFGIGGAAGVRPFELIAVGAGLYEFRARMAGPCPNATPFATTCFWRFQGPKAAGLHRLAWTLDLDAGTLRAWVDGAQVETTVVANDSFGTPRPGMTLDRNDYSPMMLGTHSEFVAADPGVTRADVAFCGLRIGNKARYADDGPGKPIRSLGGTKVDDAYRYLADGTDLIARLTMKDTPANPWDGRHVWYQAGAAAAIPGPPRPQVACGLWMPGTPAGSGDISGASVRDLGVSVEYSLGWGQAICLGSGYGFDIRDVDATGGFHGIGSMPGTSTYPVRVRDCTLQGWDAGYFGHFQIVTLERVSLGYAYEAAARFRGCDATLRDCLSVAQQSGRYAIAFHAGPYANALRVSNFLQDNEGQQAPTIAGVYFEHAGIAGPSSLLLDGLHFGTTGKGFAAVHIAEGQKDWASLRPIQFRSRDMDGYLRLPCLVRVTGPGTWTRGVVECMGNEATTMCDAPPGTAIRMDMLPDAKK